MRFEVCGRGIVVAAVVEQGPYVALVVDLDSLLCARRVVAGRGRLKHEPIDGSEDEQLADNSRHVVDNSICARRATTIYQNIAVDIGPVIEEKLTSLDAPRFALMRCTSVDFSTTRILALNFRFIVHCISSSAILFYWAIRILFLTR
jgi:hypothetical protein